MSKISILLAHYSKDAEPFLEACIRSIKAQTFREHNGVETILVSSNNVPQCEFHGVIDKHHHNGTRLHFPEAVAKAYELSDPESEYIYFCNDDTILSATCLEKLVEAMNVFPDKEMILGARSNCGLICDFYYTLSGYRKNGVTRYLSHQFRWDDVKDDIHQIIHDSIGYPFGIFKVPFAALFGTLMRRSTYEKIGKINTSFRTGQDDLEMAQRAAKMGVFCYVALAANLAHASGLTASDHLSEDDRNYNIQLLHQLSSK